MPVLACRAEYAERGVCLALRVVCTCTYIMGGRIFLKVKCEDRTICGGWVCVRAYVGGSGVLVLVLVRD